MRRIRHHNDVRAVLDKAIADEKLRGVTVEYLPGTIRIKTTLTPDQKAKLDRAGRARTALGLAGLLEHDAAGEDDVVAVAVHLDDAGLDAGAHVSGKILDATEVDSRRVGQSMAAASLPEV